MGREPALTQICEAKVKDALEERTRGARERGLSRPPRASTSLIPTAPAPMPASGSSLRVAALLPRRAALTGGRPSAKDAEEYLRRVGIRTEFLPARPPVPGQQELELPSGRPQFRFSEREPEDPEVSGARVRATPMIASHCMPV
jgi:hypothetical protein